MRTYKILLFFIFLCLLSDSLFAQEAIYKKSPNTGEVIAVKSLKTDLEIESDPILTSDEFIQSASAFIGDVTKELSPLDVRKDSLGMTHVIYRQTYNGIPVYGSEVTAHLRNNGTIKSVTGRTLKNISVDVKPEIIEKIANRVAKKAYRSVQPWQGIRVDLRKVSRKSCKVRGRQITRTLCYRKKFRRIRKQIRPQIFVSAELYIYDADFLKGHSGKNQRLVYFIQITNRTELTTEAYFVDAHNGELRKRDDGIDKSGPREIWDCSRPFTGCFLDFYSSISNYTYGRSEGMPPRGPNIDTEDGGMFLGSTDVDTLYDYLPNINNYFTDIHARDGANNRGGTGNGSSTAFQRDRLFANVDKTTSGLLNCPNGGPAYAGSTFVAVCHGQTGFHDLMGHEYGHLVARYKSYSGNTALSLINENESGALNEGWSDFMAESFERYMTGNNDWIILSGSTSFPWTRYMGDPTSSISRIGEPHADRYRHPDFYCGIDDDGGIHQNNGVVNKASHLMTEGGEFNGCSISGIGIEKVEQVWYRALTEYFSTTETFNMAYNSFLLACDDLEAVGTLDITENDCLQITKALQAVEMDKSGGCIGIDDGSPATCDVPIEPDPIIGDFDTDTDVDASDYMVWYDSIDEVGEDLPADADNNLIVDSADCQIWKSNYGTGVCLPMGLSSAPCNSNPSMFEGDYDMDGDVDSDDYMVWKDTFGQTGVDLAADGNNDGTVNEADFTLWRDNLGMGSCDLLSPALNADLDSDGDIDAEDYNTLRASFGSAASDGTPPGDLDGNGQVDEVDCLILKSSYSIGLCPPLGQPGAACPGTNPETFIGDADFDGEVTEADYAAWSSNYGATGYNPADFNNDNAVNAADYTMWRDNKGEGSCELLVLGAGLITAGDYDSDGDVDQDDRQAWVNTFGASVEPGSGADGNGDGTVDAADFTIWRDNLQE